MSTDASGGQSFPDIQGGGSLIVAWQVKGKHALVVGGGSVATSRVAHLLVADALVTVICPTDGLSDELQYRVLKSKIKHVPRKFDVTTDLAGEQLPAVVMVAVDDPVASTQIYIACKRLRVPVNIADVPPECDFYFGSMYRDGPLQVMVSTNGNGPKMANVVRRKIEHELKREPLGDAIDKLGRLRTRVREAIPGNEKADIRRRMKWVSQLSESWTIGSIAKLNDSLIDEVVRYIDQDPPTYETVISSLNP
ncbi:putative NAD(P)-binding-domain-containing protein [Lipomyces japonicus]|uniref:putative NAD(P)-binding-domain-containing protein n=1 Tax=Lipomyces japonicus TaxID=56871 RepID=UPI0034CFFFAB